MAEQSTVTKADRNLTRKMDAVRALQQLLHCAMQGDFTGFVGVKVHASKGKLQKIVKFNEEHDTEEQNSA